MTDLLGSAAAYAFRQLDPERAHQAAVALLRYAPVPASPPDPPALAVEAFGLRFPNPVGLAAGFDKNGVVADKVAALGFGHVEIGTVTPRPQVGNPRPRVFRLTKDQAVINRYGFNNAGHTASRAHLTRHAASIALGLNIGANKDSADRVADYVEGLRRFADVADYFALNVSSPNTPGLRDLQAAEALDELLARTLDARDDFTAAQGRKPVLLKISPDLALPALDDIVAVARRRGIDGMIISNTTVTRPPGLAESRMASESGGLSGKPLFALSTRMLAEAFVRVERAFPLIGVGGIDGVESAWAKFGAGATLIQLYSALIYAGPRLIGDIKRGICDRLDRNRTTLAAQIGTEARSWLQGEPPLPR